MTVVYVLAAIAILLLMIVVHEFGHYIAGKILKFKINEFSIGFGPKIFSRKSKKTGEIFSLRAIPLGGYCAFEGEDSVEDEKMPEKENIDVYNEQAAADEQIGEKSTEKELAFNDQAPWKRIIVLFAGAFFNFLSAILFSILFLSIVGVVRPVVVEKFIDGNGVEYNSQLLVGDVIYAVDGEKVSPLKSFNEIIAEHDGDVYALTVIRDGEKVNLSVTKQYIEGQNYYGLGITTQGEYQKMSFGESLKYCIPYTLKLSWMILGTFGQLITGQIPISNMSGPISTVGYMADLASSSWLNLLILLPLIASNLAVFNLLPIPALDGSKIVFAVIEWIRKKPISRKVEAYIHAIGFVALIGFVILVELMHLFG